MADYAVSLLWIGKEGKAVDRSRRERLLVSAILILIKRRVTAEQGSLEAGQRSLNLSQGYASRPKRLRKLGRVRGIFRNLRDRNFVWLVHLQRVRNRKS